VWWFPFFTSTAGWLAWAPGILYSLAIAADGLDGYLARRGNRATRLGATLDMSFDGLGVLVAGLLLIQYGQVPPWYILAACARYAFLAGEWVLRRKGKPIHALPYSPQRRIFAGIQFMFIAVVLFPVFSPPLTWWAATLFSLPFLAVFLRDWLVVSGVLFPDFRPTSELMVKQYLPVVKFILRLGLAVLAIVALKQMLESNLEPAWFSASLSILLFAAAY